MHEDMSAKEAELASTKSEWNTMEVPLKKMVRECDQLSYNLRSTRAVVACGKRGIRVFVKGGVLGTLRRCMRRRATTEVV